MSTEFIPKAHLPFEANYLGVSPQLLARTRQLWSARGLNLDEVWRETIGRFRGVQTVGDWSLEIDSGQVDQFFMFEQAAIWVASLNATAAAAINNPQIKLTKAQWRALHALTYRMIEKLDAFRLLFLTKLPTPSLQIARSISEDVDMALVFISRPKLAARFVECKTVDEAHEFWRRHIAGGRAFKAVSEQMYRAGLEFDQAGEYATWRKEVKAILGTAVHSSFQSPTALPDHSPQRPLQGNRDCHYFVTLRLQEMCAYAHGLTKDFGADLETIHGAQSLLCDKKLGSLTFRISEITVEQLRWSLANVDTEEPPISHQLH